MSHLRFYRAILSHKCATVADAATVKLRDNTTLSLKQTRLLRHFSRFTILLPKQFQNNEIFPYLTLIDGTLSFCKTAY